MSGNELNTTAPGATALRGRTRAAAPETVTPRAVNKGGGSFRLRRAQSQFKRRRADFYEDLAEALDDRAVLVDELKKQMTRAQRRGDQIAGLYQLWLKRMDSQSFSNALKGTVPTMDSLILLSAETSGRLPEGLRFLAGTVRSVDQIKATLMGAIAVPLIIASMLLGMLVGFGLFMVPILTAILPVDHWPGLGRMMYSLSMGITHYGLVMLPFVMALMASVVWAMPNWVGARRARVDKVLPFSLYRDYNGALMLVSLSGLMLAGTSMVASLRALRGAASPWMAWHIGRILSNLDREASAPAKAFNTGILAQELYDRVSDYGERSSFQEALTKIGNQALRKVEALVQKRAKVLNYLLLALSGTLMALMIGSVMLTAQQARLELTSQTSAVR